jgi:nitrite reductase/ring-hydroxylating ferredoxin subunit
LVGGTTLICPLHSWKFDLTTGRPLFGDCALKTFNVRVAGQEPDEKENSEQILLLSV